MFWWIVDAHVVCVYHKHQLEHTTLLECVSWNFIWASSWLHSTNCFCTLFPLSFRNSVSVTVLSIFRKQWRELNDTWWDDRCGGVGSTDRWVTILCAVETLFLVWQHCCWCLYWIFRATTFHPSSFISICELIPGGILQNEADVLTHYI
jgi:hypothetical protein